LYLAPTSTAQDLLFNGIGFISHASSTVSSNLTVGGAFSASSTLAVLDVAIFSSNVGIGTSSPSNVFTVEGDTMLSGDVTATGTITMHKDAKIEFTSSEGTILLHGTNQEQEDGSNTSGLLQIRETDSGGFNIYTRGSTLIFQANATSETKDRTDSVMEMDTSFVAFGRRTAVTTVRPFTDSDLSLGNSSTFWNDIYGDELILSNEGAAATAANTINLRGSDLSAEDAGLLVITEDDTQHLFASRAGFASTSPWARLSVDARNLSNDAPAFVVGSQGTSTPSLIIDGNTGLVGIATSSPVERLTIEGDTVLSSGATTTLKIQSTNTTTGAGCIEMTASDGTIIRIYVDGDNNASLKVEAGTCQ
jgi:hypothetical protein